MTIKSLSRLNSVIRLVELKEIQRNLRHVSKFWDLNIALGDYEAIELLIVYSTDLFLTEKNYSLFTLCKI